MRRVFRSADGHHDETYGKTNCVVRSDGTVHWIPPARYRVFCEVDLTNWPFGEHTCSLRLGSWTYDGNAVSMQISRNVNVCGGTGGKPGGGRDINRKGNSNLFFPLQTPNMVNLDEGCKWEIVGVTQRRRVESYSCNSDDVYEDVHYSITVRRRIPAYHGVVVVPAMGKRITSFGGEGSG